MIEKISADHQAWSWIEARGVVVPYDIREDKWAYDGRLIALSKGDHSGVDELVKALKEAVKQPTVKSTINESPKGSVQRKKKDLGRGVLDSSNATQTKDIWADDLSREHGVPRFFAEEKINPGLKSGDYLSLVTVGHATRRYGKIVDLLRKPILSHITEDFDDLEMHSLKDLLESLANDEEPEEFTNSAKEAYDELIQLAKGGLISHGASASWIEFHMQREPEAPGYPAPYLTALAYPGGFVVTRLPLYRSVPATTKKLDLLEGKLSVDLPQKSHMRRNYYLWVLALVSRIMAEDMLWTIDDALLYILIDFIPGVQNEVVKLEARTDLPGLSKITISVGPHASEADVASLFAKAKAQLLGGKQLQKAKTQKQCVAAYVFGAGADYYKVMTAANVEPKVWELLMDQWNESGCPRDDWKFLYPSRFRDAALDGYKYLMEPGVVVPTEEDE